MGNSSTTQTDAHNGELAAPLLEECKYGIEYLGIHSVWPLTNYHVSPKKKRKFNLLCFYFGMFLVAWQVLMKEYMR
jgi:hypothetical protein